MDIFLFDSHSLDALADELSKRLPRGIFANTLIIIPHHAMKEWLQIKLCREGIVALKFATPRQILQKSRADLATALWHLEECKPYLTTEKRAIDFVDALSSQFFEYSEYGFPKIEHWQKKLYDQIVLPTALEIPLDPPELFLFGLDILPPSTLQYFLRFPSVQIFRFSPCAMFWEDFCSNNERKRLLRKTPAPHRQSLDTLLQDAHPLLANWGKAVRKTLPLYPEPTSENYEIEDKDTLLHNLKRDLLLSEQTLAPQDETLRCLQTGSSRLQEVEVLRNEILALKIPFSEIRVYAPDIRPYAPLIEYCFEGIPFRIAGLDPTCQSHYYQALLRIFNLVQGCWDSDEILALFEMPVFYRQIPCTPDEVERIVQWIERGHIRSGFDALLDSFLFLQPEKETTMNWSDADLFERFYTAFDALRAKTISWKTERTLKEWADEIKTLPFLISDHTLDPTLESLRKSSSTKTFPLSFVQAFFLARPSSEMGASQLHAIRFASLETGAILPAKAIFVLGMDEESYPRNAQNPLRLPNDAPTAAEKDRYLFLSLIFAAQDKLTFTYSHRSAEDGKQVNPSLLIQELLSYCRGKEELVRLPMTRPSTTSLFSNSPAIPAPVPLRQVSLRDLTTFLKNPFLYALGITLREETESIWAPFELSSLTRHLELRSFLEEEPLPEQTMPLGLFGDLARQNSACEKAGFTKHLRDWGIQSVKSLKIDREIGGIRIVGEAHFSAPNGALHMGSDTIGAILRRWAEILCILTETSSNNIYYLKNGRVRAVVDPLESLEALLDLYARCQRSPLFLHPDWADEILRKESIPEKTEDRALLWAINRSPSYDLSVEKAIWGQMLKTSFSSLTALYPTRSNHAAV